jgi:hypothetical protein
VLALQLTAEAAVAANTRGPLGKGSPLTSGGPKTTVLHCEALGLSGGVIVANGNHQIGRCEPAA